LKREDETAHYRPNPIRLPKVLARHGAREIQLVGEAGGVGGGFPDEAGAGGAVAPTITGSENTRVSAS
jgi:hypothetical protein